MRSIPMPRLDASRSLALAVLLGATACGISSDPNGADAGATTPTCRSIQGGCECDPGVSMPGACGPDTGSGDLVCCRSSSGACDCQRRPYTGTWTCRSYTSGTIHYCNCGEGAPGGGTPTATCTSAGNGPCRASLKGGFCECQPMSPGLGTVPVSACTPKPAEVGSYQCPAGSSRVYSCDGSIAPKTCGEPGDSCSGDVDCCTPLCCGSILGCC
jgi:hypothetical protein